MAKEKKTKKITEEKLLSIVLKKYYSKLLASTVKSFKPEVFSGLERHIDITNSTKGLSDILQPISQTSKYITEILMLLAGDLSDMEYIVSCDASEDKNAADIKAVVDKRTAYLKECDFGVVNLGWIVFFIDNMFSKKFVNTLFEQMPDSENRDFIFRFIEGQEVFIPLLFRTYITLLYISAISLKNYHIKGYEVDKSGRYTILYSTSPVVEEKDYQLYISNRNINPLLKALRGKESFKSYMNELVNLPLMLCNKYIYELMQESLPLEHKFDMTNTIAAEVSADNFRMPFMNLNASNKRWNFSYYLTPKKAISIKYGRKYCIPKNGVIIDFLNKENSVDTVSTMERDFDYSFVIRYTRPEIFITEKDFEYRKFLDFKIRVAKSHVDSLIESLMNKDVSLNDKNSMTQALAHLKTNLCNIRIPYDSDLNTNNVVFNLSINHLILCCLYIVFVDMNMGGVKVFARKEVEKDGVSYIERDYDFRTAHIRRLPNSWSTSQEAKDLAGKMGIILPHGYTFVREHHHSDDAKRVIKIREHA